MITLTNLKSANNPREATAAEQMWAEQSMSRRFSIGTLDDIKKERDASFASTRSKRSSFYGQVQSRGASASAEEE